MPIITLTTDFGASDWFVGAMKGVILGIAPKAQIVDITHQIPPGDIRAGAFALAAGCHFFPKGTIHVGVVDPGVGGSRAPIGVASDGAFFIGPDNGLLSFAVRRAGERKVRRLENSKLHLSRISRTFHGRDIFAPVAAHLANGIAFNMLGPEQPDFVKFSFPVARRLKNDVCGEVLYIDHFGNAITNISVTDLAEYSRGKLEVWCGRKRLCPVASHYQAVPLGKAVAVLGSTDLLEIAVNGGNAARRMHLNVGTKLLVRPATLAA